SFALSVRFSLLPLRRRPRSPPLFPYTTLFRSAAAQQRSTERRARPPSTEHRGSSTEHRAPRLRSGVHERDLEGVARGAVDVEAVDRKSTRLNSSHVSISYAVFCLKKKKTQK